jgi:hypothetical protein
MNAWLVFSIYFNMKIHFYGFPFHLFFQQNREDIPCKTTSNAGSQTDLTNESPLDKRELKIEYKESIKEVQRLHGEIDRVEDQLRNSPTDNGTNNANVTTLMLIEEKEALLDEIRRLGSMVKSEEEKVRRTSNLLKTS